MKYLNVWKQLVGCSFATFVSSRLNSAGYMLGKLARFGFFWLFIISIFRFTDTLAGYNKYEVLLFFVTFNLVDVLAQAFFRGVYRFRQDMKEGTFDHILTKPVNALFFAITRLTDLLDFIFLIPIVLLLGYVLSHISFTWIHLILYCLLVLLGLVIILGIHIISICVTLLTAESEQVIWFYRETMALGRFPPEIFSSTIQWIFTYIFPILITIAFPVKALLGMLSGGAIFAAMIIAFIFFSISLLLWRVSVRHYSSAA